MSSYEFGKSVATNMKALKDDRTQAEPWAKKVLSAILLCIACLVFSIAEDSKSYFIWWLLASLVPLYFAYDVAKDEWDAFFSHALTIVKWIAIIGLCLTGLILAYKGLEAANPIVLAILFGAWMIVNAINSNK